ncbi:MAG: hypothetical protein V1709_08955, partial [Planctomycetota bacterium]
IQALSRIKDKSVIPQLLDFKNNVERYDTKTYDTNRLYCNTLVALAQLGEKSVGANLIDILKHPEKSGDFNKDYLVNVTGSICDKTLLPEVVEMLKNGKGITVTYAVTILNSTTDKSIIPELISLLESNYDKQLSFPDRRCPGATRLTRFKYVVNGSLKKITNQSFSKPEEWREWWQNNKDKIEDEK